MYVKDGKRGFQECKGDKGKGKIKITFCAIRLFPQNSKILKVSGLCKAKF